MTAHRNPADDVVALRALACAYAHHADCLEPDRLAELFEPDGVLRMVRRGASAAPAVSRGRDAISSAVARLHRFEHTFHHVGNHLIDLREDDATGEVYCVAHHVSGTGHDAVDHVMYIRYQDRYRFQHGAWRFTERETVVDWEEQRTAGTRTAT
jgi:hypothetical protein